MFTPNYNRQLIINGIPNRFLYFHQKDITVPRVSHVASESGVERGPGVPTPKEVLQRLVKAFGETKVLVVDGV